MLEQRGRPADAHCSLQQRRDAASRAAPDVARTHASFTGKHNNVAAAAAAVAAAGLTNCMWPCTRYTQAHALRPVIAGTMEEGGGLALSGRGDNLGAAAVGK